MANESKITSDLEVDDELVQNADYRFNQDDRQYIDKQSLGVQQHLVDALIKGLHATYYVLDASSVATAEGDGVCAASSALGTVTKAVTAALTGAISVQGIVLRAAPPGGRVLVAIGGKLPPALTGLAIGTAGFVKINGTTGRCELAASLTTGDYGIGTVDAAGYMQVVPGIGVGVTAGGGEANTGANVGATGAGVFRDKTGTTLNLRKIKAGANIVVTQNADDIEIAGSAGGGSPAGATGTLQYNNAGVLGGAANVQHAGGDLVTGANLGVVATAGAHRTRGAAYTWLSRSVTSGTDKGVVEHDNDATVDWISIGSYGDYADPKTVDEVWLVAKKASYTYVGGSTPWQVTVLTTGGTAWASIAATGTNFVIMGTHAALTGPSNFGGGAGVFLWGSANTAPTTNPAAGSILGYVDPADAVLKFRRSSGAIAPIAAPAVAMPALAIDWSKGQVQTKDLAAGVNTFTFSNDASGMSVTVRVTSHASGSTVVWPAAVRWTGGTEPVQSTPSKTDVYTFIHDGTNVYGSFVQDFS